MKLLVCISKVPDTTTKISFTDNNTKFNTDGVQWVINPADEWYALVRALELKEAAGGTVTVINVGGAENEPVIRKALAIGADDAVRINAEEKDALFVARQIAEFAKEGGFDIIFTGKETIDHNGSMVGAALAEMLDIDFISQAITLDAADGRVTADREIEGGVEKVSVAIPVVVSASKGLAEARIPNMRGIMAARTKPLEVKEGMEGPARTIIEQYEEPAAKSEVKLVDPENVGELVRLLHEEAKVI